MLPARARRVGFKDILRDGISQPVSRQIGGDGLFDLHFDVGKRRHPILDQHLVRGKSLRAAHCPLAIGSFAREKRSCDVTSTPLTKPGETLSKVAIQKGGVIRLPRAQWLNRQHENIAGAAAARERQPGNVGQAGADLQIQHPIRIAKERQIQRGESGLEVCSPKASRSG